MNRTNLVRTSRRSFSQNKVETSWLSRMAGALSSRVKRMMSGDVKGANMFEIMEPRQMLSGASVNGSEFTVNSSSGLLENQTSATVGYASDGSFVVAWDGPGTGDSGFGSSGVFFQRYNSSGAKVGSETRVNTHTTSGQSAPSIAVASDGSFVIAWHGRGSGETGSDSVYFQRYDSAGSASGANVRANSHTTGSQVNASIGLDSSGGFVIAWHGDGPTADSGDGVFARRFSSGGSAVGSEFLVNTYTTGDQQEASVAVASDGSFIVAWEGPGTGETSNRGIFYQRYNSGGTASGSNTLVNTGYTTGDQDNPAIALKSTGEFIIVWDGGGTGDTGEGIFGQRYDSSGSTVGSNFRANTYVTGNQNNASVAYTSDGGFVVAWNGEGSGDSTGVYAQVFYSNGAADGSAFRANAYTTDSQNNPSIAVTGGNMVIAWDGGTSALASNEAVARRYTIVANSAPTVSSAITDVTVDEDAIDTKIDLTTKFADVDEAASKLTYTVLTNTNTALVTTSISSGVLTLDYVADEFGTATITVQATDTGGATVTDTFDVTVNSKNDAPTFTATDPAAVDEDTGGYTLTGWATANLGPANESETATYTVEVISGGSILSAGPSINTNGDLTYTVAADEFGTVSFKVKVSDGTDETDWQTFSIVVENVNDVPSFNASATDPGLAVNEDAGEQTITGWAVANLGPANESETATYTVNITSGSELINGDITVDASGNLTFTPADDAFGTVEFTVKLSDGTDETATQNFSIVISSVNDAPAVPTLSSIPTVVEDTVGVQTVTGFASSNIGPSNEEPQTLSYDLEVISGGDKVTGLSIDASGTLTYSLVANAFGDVVFKVRAYDGFDYSEYSEATISITGVNDAPTVIGDPEDQYLDEDAGAQSITGWVTFDLGGNNNEGETAVFTVNVTEGADLLDSGPTIDSNGTLHFTPKDDAFGTIIFNLKLSDGSKFTVANGFIIEIAPINDAPSVTAADPDAVDEDSGPTTLPGWASATSPDNELPETYTFELEVVSGGSLLSAGPVLTNDGELSFTPADDAFGEVVFKARASDGTTNSKWVCYTITINNVNDAPTFTAGDTSSDEDAGAQSVTGWATANLGPANETSDTATFTVEVVSGGDLLAGGPEVDSSGTLTYTAANNAFGEVIFKAKVSDGTDSTDWQEYKITINPVNDAPTFDVDDSSIFVDEDAGLQTLTNWATADLGPANETSDKASYTVEITSGAGLINGSIQVDADGTLTFTPADDAFGEVDFKVQVSDGTDSSYWISCSITIDPVNDAPTFTATDPAAVNEDSGHKLITGWATANLGPANETEDSATYTVEFVSGGSILTELPTINSSGDLFFTPAANQFGSVVIKVQVSDGTDSSDWQEYTITVNNVNDAPSFLGEINIAPVDEDSGETTLTGWATFDLGANNNEGETPTWLIYVSAGADLLVGGTPSIDVNGNLSFTPAPDQFGLVTFTVKLSDGTATTKAQAFVITIDPVNDAPSFEAEDPTVDEDSGANTIPGWATANLGPANEQTPTPETATYTVEITDGGALLNGGITLNSSGDLSFTPADDAFGEVSFKVKISDGTDSSDWTTHTITIENVNDAPSFTANDPSAVDEDAGPQTVPSWATANLGPANENETAAYTVVITDGADLIDGDITVSSDGTLSFTPAADQFGTVTFAVTVSDGTDETVSQEFTVTINPINDAPTFEANDITGVLEDTGAQTVTGWATANLGPSNEEPETATYTVQVVSGGDLFSVDPAVDSDGTLTYTLAADAFGEATIKVRVSDGTDNSDWQCYTITVDDVNDAPTWTAVDPDTVLEDSGTTTLPNWATFNLGPANEGDTATFTVEFTSGGDILDGLPTIDSNGTLSFTPAANQFGQVVFTVSLSDGTDKAITQSFIIDVDPVNDEPTFEAEDPTIDEDAGAQSVTGWATANLGPANEAPETATYTVEVISGGELLSAGPSIDTNGTLTYTPVADANGEVSFKAKVSDGTDSSSWQTYTITINAVNDAPTFTASNPPSVTEDASAQTVTGWATANLGPSNEAPETATYTVTPVSGGEKVTGLSIDSSGTLSYTPVANAFGDVVFKVSVSDGTDSSAEQQFTLTINGVNEAPSFTSPVFTTTVKEDAGLQTIAGWATYDLGGGNNEGETAVFTVAITKGAELIDGSVTVDSTGALSFTPAKDAFGEVTFTVKLSDGTTTTKNQARTITITPVNDAPTILTANTNADNVDGGKITISGFGSASSPANELPETYTYGASVTAGDSLLSGGTVSINSSTGDLEFTPADINTDGVVTIKLTVSDNNGGSSEKSVDITINDKTRPTVTSVVSGDAIDSKDSVTVTFSEGIDVGSFDWSDLTLTRDGGGNLITSGTGVTFTLDSGTTYTISGLAGVTNYVGAYTLTLLDAGVTDSHGNTLNGAGTTSFNIGTVAGSTPVIGAGLEGVTSWVKTSTPNVTGTATPGATVDLFEGVTKVGSGTADASGKYDVTVTLANGAHTIFAVASSPTNTAADSGTVTINVDTLIPTNASQSVISPVERTNALLTVNVRFSAKLDLSSFDFNDLVLTRNGGGNIATSGITIALTNPSNNTYTITMPAALVNTVGSYSLTVNGAGILNQAFNAVSNNRTTTWTLIAATPSAPSLDVASEGKAGSGYTQFTTPTVKGTGSVGSTVEVYEGATLLGSGTVAANGQYSITLSTLSVGTHILKTRALEGAGAAPTAYSADYTIRVETATPTIANVSSYPTPRTVPVTQPGIRFSSRIDVSTVSAADFTLTRDGVPVSLTGLTFTETNPTTFNYAINLPTGSTTTAGVYVLSVTGSGIKNLAGKDVGNNATINWTLLPAISSISQYSAPRTTPPVTEVGIRFTVSLNLATFTFADLSLTRDSISVDISTVTITAVMGDPTKYVINIPSAITSIAGAYSLTVTGAGITSSNALTVSNNITTTWTQL
jgi:hypothetical protein